MLRISSKTRFLPGWALRTRKLNTLVNISSRKSGSFGGPFSQLPEFTPLQDSILISLPSSCTVYTKTDKVSVISADPNVNENPVIFKDAVPGSGFSRLFTREEPINAMLVSSTPMSNVLVLELDDYNEGWYLADPQNSVICYSGDLTFASDGRHLVGRGVVAVSGEGPVYQLQLGENESIIVSPDAILGHDKKVRLETSVLGSHAGIPEIIKKSLSQYAQSYLDTLNITWHKLFAKSRTFYQATGPGTLLLQTSFVPETKVFTDDDLSKALK
ncbi:AIM24 family protein [Lachancea thermotolerans CBS 6340]|uniref:Altered inheritance of mitochondria protein 24, mitochondrial n=1 Tax=Lachancea thermotolerans (strain ATCC 56472 / CBS 6340 / NRRL Y-8284) TaxID=559295 RepID=C5DM47_LACTC|nr:KLTH0G05940p [Lachancea thermotolerans CBS 6340]CAR24858.1 KLTH0G05940p [Lachancea thermotolerans CBS 6340]